MAFLKFNKAELVNLSYSLKREIICAGKTGAYCNTSIVACNTRRYHGLLSVTLDRFGGDKFLLLSSLDESLIVSGKQFNLGIHCYGDVYEPRGHKYVVDFEADPIPAITFKVGEVVLRKSILLLPDKDQVLLKYELLSAPAPVTMQLRPFLAFRNIHALTCRNDEAATGYDAVQGGASFRLYANFPNLVLQTLAGTIRSPIPTNTGAVSIARKTCSFRVISKAPSRKGIQWFFPPRSRKRILPASNACSTRRCAASRASPAGASSSSAGPTCSSAPTTAARR